MKLKILPLLYLAGVLPVVICAPRPIAHDYYLILTPKTWNNAQTYCRANYDDLATVTSTDDWTKLVALEKSKNFASIAWIGLYNDYQSWHWSYKHAPLKISLWAPSEPNNLAGHESCGAMDIYGQWSDWNCQLLKPFLCYNASYSGRFIIVTDPMKTWPDAQTYCRQYHTDLATSDNQTDNSLLKDLVQSSTWFGLVRDTWKWSDQSNHSVINWIPGSPDNYGGAENCGSVAVDHIGDTPCANLQPFFCHTIPPMKEIPIVRMRISSNQNLNDPALMLSILDMIQQELKNHGMTQNITVTWRQQPDGNVFYEDKDVTNTDSSNTECVNPK